MSFQAINVLEWKMMNFKITQARECSNTDWAMKCATIPQYLKYNNHIIPL